MKSFLVVVLAFLVGTVISAVLALVLVQHIFHLTETDVLSAALIIWPIALPALAASPIGGVIAIAAVYMWKPGLIFPPENSANSQER
jgi:hypothetical protein